MINLHLLGCGYVGRHRLHFLHPVEHGQPVVGLQLLVDGLEEWQVAAVSGGKLSESGV